MSFQIIRRIGANGVWAAGGYTMIRQQGANGAFSVAARPAGFQIMRLPTGPMGPTPTYELWFFAGGASLDAEVIGIATARGVLTLDPTNCVATLEGAPTGTAIYTVTKNGNPWVTITFAPGATDGVIAFAGNDYLIEVGDKLVCTAPSPPDLTASGFAATLASA